MGQASLKTPLLGTARSAQAEPEARVQPEVQPAEEQSVGAQTNEEDVAALPRCQSAIDSMLNSSAVEKLDLLEAFDSRPLPGSGTSNELQTIFNTVNLYVGIGLLTIAYAVKLGGWLSLGFLAIFSTLFCYSAVLICRSFEQLPSNSLPSYPNLGLAAVGPPGQWLVMVVAITEFFGALCMCLIVVWQSVVMLLPFHDRTCIAGKCISTRWAVILGSALVILPATWIRSFSRLTGIAMTGVMSSALLTAVVIAAYFKDPSQEYIKDRACEQHSWVNVADLPVAAGILIVSLSGHAGLPSLRRSMRRPQNFEHCLFGAFFIMFCLYALMGGIGYLYFGNATQVLITRNLTSDSSMASVLLIQWGRFRLSIGQLLTGLVTLSAYSTIPPLVFVVAELLLDIAFHQLKAQASGLLVVGVRTLVVLAGYAVSVLMFDVLGSLESLVGGIGSVCSSLLLPAFFYYIIHRQVLSPVEKAGIVSLVLLGACATALIAVVNIQKLRGQTEPG